MESKNRGIAQAARPPSGRVGQAVRSLGCQCASLVELSANASQPDEVGRDQPTAKQGTSEAFLADGEAVVRKLRSRCGRKVISPDGAWTPAGP